MCNRSSSLGGENKALPLSFHYVMSWNGADEEWGRLAADTTFRFGKPQS